MLIPSSCPASHLVPPARGLRVAVEGVLPPEHSASLCPPILSHLFLAFLSKAPCLSLPLAPACQAHPKPGKPAPSGHSDPASLPQWASGTTPLSKHIPPPQTRVPCSTLCVVHWNEGSKEQGPPRSPPQQGAGSKLTLHSNRRLKTMPTSGGRHQSSWSVCALVCPPTFSQAWQEATGGNRNVAEYFTQQMLIECPPNSRNCTMSPGACQQRQNDSFFCET